MSCRWCRVTLPLVLGALSLIAHDGLDEQLAAASNAIAQDPLNAALLLRRAELHRLHGDLERARADVVAAQNLGTLLSGVDRQLGKILMDHQDFAGAGAAFSRHLSACPNDGDARSLRARCALALGDQDTARQDLEAACALLHQPDPDLLCQLADLLHQSGHTDAAIARLDAAIARDGTIPAYVERALAIERASHRFAAMLERLDRLVASTGQTRWVVERAELLMHLGQTEKAQAAYQQAAQALADLPMARRQVAANRLLLTRIEHGLGGTSASLKPESPARTPAP